jgi:hypothetical protein
MAGAKQWRIKCPHLDGRPSDRAMASEVIDNNKGHWQREHRIPNGVDANDLGILLERYTGHVLVTTFISVSQCFSRYRPYALSRSGVSPKPAGEIDIDRASRRKHAQLRSKSSSIFRHGIQRRISSQTTLRRTQHDGPRDRQFVRVSGRTISTWLKKNGIPSSDRRHNPDAEYKDPDILEKLYQNEGLSTHAIAEKFGVSSGTIHHALVSMGIDTRSRSEANSEGPGVAYHTQKESGYPAVSARGSDRTVQVRVHQLVAIADGADPQDVFSNGSYHVHHKNGCAFNNRPSNLEILTAEEHAALTHKSR